jgi:hypothetical protein
MGIFPKRNELRAPILELLRDRQRPSWEIEEHLARKWEIPESERHRILGNGHEA